MADNIDIIVKLVDEATASLRSIKQEVSSMGTSVDETNQKAGAFNTTIRNAAIALGTGALLSTVKNVAVSMYESAASFEQVQVAMRGMIGDTQTADTLLRDLTNFAATTPFEIPTIQESAKRLLAYGNTAEEIIPLLQMLGDVSSVVGTDKLPNMITAMGQIKAKGVLMGEELRQLTETGIPIMGQLAEVTGLSVADITNDTKSLGITYDQVVEAMKRMDSEGGIAFNAMQNQMGTMGGQMSNLKDQWNKFIQAITPALSSVLVPALSTLNGWLNTISTELQDKGFIKYFEDHKETLSVLAGIIGGVLIGAVVGLTVALWGLLGPVILIGGAFAIVGAQVALLYTKFQENIEIMKSWWPTIKEAWTTVIDAISTTITAFFDKIKADFDAVSTFFTDTWNTIKEVFNTAVAFIAGLVIITFDAMGIDIVGVMTTIWTNLTNIWNSITTYFSEKMTWLSTTWQSVWATISTYAKTKWDEIKGWFTAAYTEISSIFSPWVSSMGDAWKTMWDSMTSAATTAWETAKNIVKEGINWIIDKVNTMIDKINTVIKTGASALGLGDKVATLSHIPKLAEGGEVVGAGTVMVGERGPELLNLPKGASVTPLEKAGGITININNPYILSDNDIVEKIGDPILRVLKQYTAVV